MVFHFPPPPHPPQHGGCIQREFIFRKIPFAEKEDKWKIAGWGWFLSSPRGEKLSIKEAELWKFAGGKCCVSPWAEDSGVWALFVNPGCFNRETSDKPGILWLSTCMCMFHQWMLFSFSFDFQVSPPPPPQMTKLRHPVFAPPPCFPTPQIWKQPKQNKTLKTASPLILVTVMVKTLQVDTELDMLLHFLCVEMSRKIASLLFCLFGVFVFPVVVVLLLFCVLLLWKTRQPSSLPKVCKMPPS